LAAVASAKRIGGACLLAGLVQDLGFRGVAAEEVFELANAGRDVQNRPGRMTPREVPGIDGDVRLNRVPWTLVERMAELKAAA
jgi:hypothetical protein